MRPGYHIVASFVGIPVYILTKSFELALCFSIAEIAMDVDHLFDYAIFDKHRFTPHPVPPYGGTGGIPPHGRKTENKGTTGVNP